MSEVPNTTANMPETLSKISWTVYLARELANPIDELRKHVESLDFNRQPYYAYYTQSGRRKRRARGRW